MKHLLSAFVCLGLLRASGQTSTHSTANVYTNIASAGAGWVQVKLWGAGGGNGSSGVGGGGAFSQVALPASPGDSLVTVVGQHGANSGTTAGGNGSGDAPGGAPGYLGDYNSRGQGGQGSSAFQWQAGQFVMRAVAGAGGGAGLYGNGAGGGQAAADYNSASGGQPGFNGSGGAGADNGSPGGNYNGSAMSTGISLLSLANGAGGNGGSWSGGGGGGYGGGGGGGGGTGGDGAGGGGGGSWGDATIPGNSTQPGNTTDPAYVSGWGAATHDGLAVVTYATGGTLGATNVLFNQATVRGSINEGGLSTVYHFDYSFTTGYGFSTSVSNVPSGSGAVVVSVTLTNLASLTNYHYRVIFSNSGGTLTGLDETFYLSPVAASYASAGVYTNVVPVGTGWAQVKVWGAGGGNGSSGTGGGGAFAQVALPANAGDTLVTVVGQRGASSTNTLGGAGSGDTVGGSPGNLGDDNGRGQGGQGSSLFQLVGGTFIMKAVAGAGGGAGYEGNGAGGGVTASGYNSAVGGQPGVNGTGGAGGATGLPGDNYAGNAATTGLTALNLVGGNGGSAGNWSGGGGGGYGGGGGGGGGSSGDGAGGGGGGSYGDQTVAGNGTQAGNTNDTSYVSGAGSGDRDGLALITYAPGGTLAATNLQFTEATLRGSINPGGLATVYHFDYGSTTNYGSSTSVSNVPSGSGTIVVGQTLLNFVMQTNYHYRVVFSNASGTLTGMDETFAILPVVNGYTSAGVYTNVVPAGVNKAVFKLWGAGGGGNSSSGTGGGGAFSSVTLNVSPGETFVTVVGQRGAVNTNVLGGAGTGDTMGGAPGFLGDYNGRGQGGQATSLFQLTNSLLVLKAVAGAGGGAGYYANGGPGGLIGADSPYTTAPGGAPGTNGVGGAAAGGGNPGTNYAANATTAGIASLNLAKGNGGAATNWSGGGGGGYGGGAGGGGDNAISDSTGGGGGGSYGATIITGSGATPGNTSDASYLAPAGQGGNGTANGYDGLAVVLWQSGSAPKLTASAKLANGSFQFAFTNIVVQTTFTVEGSTNLAATNGWTVLGQAMEIAPGQFQFTDAPATNRRSQFYRVSSP